MIPALSCNRSIAFDVRIDFHWLLGKRVKGEQLVARFLQAISDGLALQAPLANERLALRLNLLLRADVDHILVIGGKFVMQPIGSMSEKVAMLMHRAALNRDVGPQCGKGFLEAGRAVDDGEFPASSSHV